MPNQDDVRAVALAAIITLIPIAAYWLKLSIQLATKKLEAKLEEMESKLAKADKQEEIRAIVRNGHSFPPSTK